MSVTCRLFFLTSVFFFVLIGCSPQRPHLHRVAEYHTYRDAMDFGFFSKYILIEPGFSQNLKTALRAVEISQFREAKKYLNDLTTNENIFLIGVIFLEKRKYEEALIFFEELYENDPTHIQAGLLMLDCKLRLENQIDYWGEYQKLYDKCMDEVLCKLVETRFRYKQHGLY
jgi:tetratricopeptide (TPR) repeat protein